MSAQVRSMVAGESGGKSSGRRDILRAGLTVTCSLLIGPPGFASDDPDWAVAFMKRVGGELAGILTRPGSAEQRETSLRSFIDKVVDVESTARFCLGRFWTKASPEQKKEYVTLFHDVLMRTILVRVGKESHDTAGVRISIEPSYSGQDEVLVPMVLTRGASPPFRVTWGITPDARNPRIIDVMAEQISLRVTIQSDYGAFLNRHDGDIGALLDALRHQACDGCGGAGSSGR
jgi:phospholipid transport system substrate-binding protein